MHRFARSILGAVVILSSTGVAFGQPPARFEDVVRNLRNPDEKVRISAVRLLREAGYAEAIAPMAPLINDPVNDIQLEAIGAELSFYLVEDVPTKKRVALVVEVRSEGRAPAAFEMGPLASWPKPVPPELIDALLTAIDDDNSKVRVEAIYSLGVIARPPLPAGADARLIKALDHYDSTIRTAAARVIGRLQVKTAGDGLFKAINDSNADVRYAAMRALGEIREERAVQTLNEQFTYYGKGEGAWSALDALARIAHPSSAQLFKSHLSSKDPYLRRASAEGLARIDNKPELRIDDRSELMELLEDAGNDQSDMARAAMAFALYKKGNQTYLGRLVDFMDSDRTAPQIQSYLVELGPSVVPQVVPLLQEPDESLRKNLVAALGLIGDQSTLPALTPLKSDRDRDVVAAATQAIERIRMSGK
jgi:HEAT repeat protein